MIDQLQAEVTLVAKCRSTVSDDPLFQVLQPIAALLFPVEAETFDDHHAFMVQYKPNEDLGLDMHTDDSDVTFNVALGREGFKGAGLTFCGTVGKPDHRQFNHTYKHRVGHAVLHLGSRRHGADDIISGERNNLIVWNHNNVFRNSRAYHEERNNYEPESGKPSKRCLSYTHDRDYGAYKAYPAGTEEFKGKGWCPPHHACYDGMERVFARGEL